MSCLKALLASELGCLSLSIFVVPCIRFRRSKGGRAPPFLNESWPRLEGVGFLLLQRRATPLFLNGRSLFCQTFGLLIWAGLSGQIQTLARAQLD